MKIVAQQSLVARTTRNTLFGLAINREGKPKSGSETALRLLNRWRGRSGAVVKHMYNRKEHWKRLERWRSCKPYGWTFTPDAFDKAAPKPFTCQQPRICPWCYCRSISGVVSSFLRLPKLLPPLGLKPERFNLLATTFECSVSELSGAPVALSKLIGHAGELPGLGGWARLFPLPLLSERSNLPRASFVILLVVPTSDRYDEAELARHLELPNKVTVKLRVEPLADETRVTKLLTSALAYPRAMMEADPYDTATLLRNIAQDKARMKLARSFGPFRWVDGLLEGVADARKRLPRPTPAHSDEWPEEMEDDL